jgi:hypothetical protein
VPTELRRIVFTNDELRQALDAHLMHQQAKNMPMGLVTSARLNADQTKVVLGIYDRRNDENHTIEIGANHVAAALLRYCFSNGVPLPKDAKKSITTSGDNVALDIKREAGAAQPSIVTIDTAKPRAARTGT